MFLENFLQKLENVKPHGDGFMARCPAHDDGKNSLSVKQSGKKILVKCFAGCDTAAILSKLGLAMRDLHELDVNQTVSKPKSQIVATYNYNDESGNLVHQTVRFEPKKFLQRRPDPAKPDEWIWNLQDITPVLYNLGEIPKAINNNLPIFIVEGEKDCDNIKNHLEFTATTCPMGASKWRPHYSDWLINADVYIIPDNDEPGQKHANQVAESLLNKAASVKIIDLKNKVSDKGDISDFILSRPEETIVNDFLELMNNAKVFETQPQQDQSDTTPLLKTSLTWEELETLKIPPLVFTIDKLLPQGLFILAGAPKVGKSWLTLDLCVAVAEGKQWLDHQATQGSVMYYALEDNWRRLQSRIKIQHGTLTNKRSLQMIIKPLGITELGNAIFAQVKSRPDTRLVCIDTIAYVRDYNNANTISYSHDRKDMAAIKEIANLHDITIVCIQHTRKMGDSNNKINQISGSTGLTGTTDGNMVLGKKHNMETKGVLLIENRDTKNVEFNVEFDENTFRWKNLGEKIYEEITHTTEKDGFTEIFLKHYLADGEPKPYKEIKERADWLKITDRQLRYARDKVGIKFTGKGSHQGTYWYL